MMSYRIEWSRILQALENALDPSLFSFGNIYIYTTSPTGPPKTPQSDLFSVLSV